MTAPDFLTWASIVVAAALTSSQQGRPVATPQPDRLIAVERGLTAHVRIIVDIPARRVEHSYRFMSAKAAVDLEVQASRPRAKPSRLTVLPGVPQELREVEELSETTLGRSGRSVRVDPRIRLRRDERDAAMLVANYEFDIEVQLPAGARVLSSLIPFRQETPTQLRWKQSGLTVMPPIDILYTLAAESVSISKQVSESGPDVSVLVVLRNDGAGRIVRLDLRAQFPKGFYEPRDAESSGEFRLLDHQTYRWSAQLINLDAGQSQELTLSLTKRDPMMAAWDFEVFVYNATGDLVAKAPAIR